MTRRIAPRLINGRQTVLRYPMRSKYESRISLAIFVCLSFGCSGGGSSPTAPTTLTTTSTTVSTPVPTPTARFPSMAGGWSGTLNVSVVVRGTGQRASNICTETWIVTAQTDGRFSGTFQSSGGTTASCSDSGSFTGDVSATGTLSRLTPSGTSSSGATTCTRIGGDGNFTGVVSGALALTAERRDAQRCTTTFTRPPGVSPTVPIQAPITVEADRTLTLTMQKR